MSDIIMFLNVDFVHNFQCQERKFTFCNYKEWSKIDLTSAFSIINCLILSFIQITCF